MEDGQKVYVSPEDEKKIRVASQIDVRIPEEDVEIVSEQKRKSDTSDSSSAYEDPIGFPGKFSDAGMLSKTCEDVRNQPDGMLPEERHTFPLHGRKRLIIEDFEYPKPAPESKPSNEGLNLPPHMREDAAEHDLGEKSPRLTELLNKLFRKNHSANAGEPEVAEMVSDPANEQIPVEVSLEELKLISQNEERRPRMTFKSIFGIEKVEKKSARPESAKEMEERPSEEDEGQLEIEKITEFRGEEEEESVKAFPGTIPLRNRWGPQRRQKTASLPEAPKTEKGILSTKWKKNKKNRPVSFAAEPIIYNIRSDTESADHGSADKSSVSKLTEEKQQKRFLGQLLDSIKRKNKDKVADNEALRNIPITIDKDLEPRTQKDSLKTDGIVYAELDIARSPGNVVRRDDEKTEYAEIIHPKAGDFKKARDELRKSRENLSGSREHLTEDDGTTITPDGKKEAAV